jgi:hypothetical protein
MKLFGRQKEHLRIKNIEATRAVMVLHEETQECNIRLVTQDGEVLDLTIPDRILPEFILDLQDVYEAIHPPLRRGSRQSTWMGMGNDS